LSHHECRFWFSKFLCSFCGISIADVVACFVFLFSVLRTKDVGGVGSRQAWSHVHSRTWSVGRPRTGSGIPQADILSFQSPCFLAHRHRRCCFVFISSSCAAFPLFCPKWTRRSFSAATVPTCRRTHLVPTSASLSVPFLSVSSQRSLLREWSLAAFQPAFSAPALGVGGSWRC
jgi:hypothetical protein